MRLAGGFIGAFVGLFVLAALSHKGGDDDD